MNRRLVLVVAWIAIVQATHSAESCGQDQAYREVQGQWQVVEVVDNGRSIPREAIPTFLPSGGLLEIVDSTILFQSRQDGQRHARSFVLDATSFPKLMNLVQDRKLYAQGIYQIAQGRLVVCFSPVGQAPRPTEFAAPEGSRRALMVLERVNAKPPTATPVATTVTLPPPPTTPPTPAPPTPAPPAPTVAPAPVAVTPVAMTTALSEADVRRLLPGTWQLADAYGALFLALRADGIYETYRETVSTSAFQKVFSKVPVSSGTWSYSNGAVVFNCTSASQPERVHRTFPFFVKSISPAELVFVDYAGKTGKAVRTP
jgi:uncharacterized protein (TIGR03067 family)